MSLNNISLIHSVFMSNFVYFSLEEACTLRRGGSHWPRDEAGDDCLCRSQRCVRETGVSTLKHVYFREHWPTVHWLNQQKMLWNWTQSKPHLCQNYVWVFSSKILWRCIDPETSQRRPRVSAELHWKWTCLISEDKLCGDSFSLQETFVQRLQSPTGLAGL